MNKLRPLSKYPSAPLTLRGKCEIINLYTTFHERMQGYDRTQYDLSRIRHEGASDPALRGFLRSKDEITKGRYK